MILPLPRKRTRDVADDFDTTLQPLEKRSRPLAGRISFNSLTASSPWTPTNTSRPSEMDDEQETGDDSPQSNVSEAGSSADVDMDSDMDGDAISFSQSPVQSSPWNLRPSPIRPANRPTGIQPSTRVATPMVPGPSHGNRPWTAPLQTSISPSSYASSSGLIRSDRMPRNSLSTVGDRFPSPVDEDEPHTPTADAGSQMSLLTVNDMEIDMDPPVPPPEGDTSAVRKQRQRSGAFTSTPDAARKFSMGFRNDCEKCRMRVPGHMNHFLGA